MVALVVGSFILPSCSTIQNPSPSIGVVRQSESIENSARNLINRIKSIGEKHELETGAVFYNARGYNRELQSEVLFQYNEFASSLDVAIVNHPYSRNLPPDSPFRGGKLDILEYAKEGEFHGIPHDVHIDLATNKEIGHNERFGIDFPLSVYQSDPTVKRDIDSMYATAIRTTTLSR